MVRTNSLFAHEPSTLIPLLQAQMPHSISLLGTVLSNSPSTEACTTSSPDLIAPNDDAVDVEPPSNSVPARDPAPAPTPEPAHPAHIPTLHHVYATFPPRRDGGIITSDYLRSLGIGEHDWLVITALPRPSEQMRFYHSIVSASRSSSSSLTDPAAMIIAQAVVVDAVTEMRERYPDQLILGDVHEFFDASVRELIGAPKRGVTHTYLAPGGGFGHTSINLKEDLKIGEDGISGGAAHENNLVLDHGRPADAELIYSTNPYRLPEYYASRAAYTTVLRPRRTPLSRPQSTNGKNVLSPQGAFSIDSHEEGDDDGDAKDKGEPSPPVAWVMTHGDGSLGALWTQPAYRGNGLSKIILAAHLASIEKMGIPGYCHVEDGNVASMGLWESLGWTRLPWTSSWVFAERGTDK